MFFSKGSFDEGPHYFRVKAMPAFTPLQRCVAGYSCRLENGSEVFSQFIHRGAMMQAIADPVNNQEVAWCHQSAQLLPVSPVAQSGHQAAIAVKDESLFAHDRGEGAAGYCHPDPGVNGRCIGGEDSAA